MKIDDIIQAIRNNRIRITNHADEESHSDNFTFDEVFISVVHGEIIEDYPKDKPYPSCLIFGKNFKSEPIHSVWAYNPETDLVILDKN